MTENELSRIIIGAAIEVHRILGPGLLEDLYEEALCHELALQGLTVARQVPVPVMYKGRLLDKTLKLDVIVNDLVVVECKHAVKDHPVFQAQCLTYLKLTGMRLGLVIYFGLPMLKDGIHRVVNNLPDGT
ncbi:MAG: GxxExxY protein [Planctomycetaceae bacterium]